MCFFRQDFGVGVGQGKHHRLVGHALHHGRAHQIGTRHTNKDIRTIHCLGQRAQFGFACKRFLEGVEVGAIFVHHPFGIDEKYVALFCAHRNQQVHRGNTGSAGAQTDNFCGFQGFPLNGQGVDQPGANDDGGAVLVVVEYRNVETFAQRRFNFKAMRRGDVFEVDPAERGGDGFNHLDEFLRRFDRHFDIEHIDAGKLLE